ncbi:DUF1178 family protein [Eleftheria terrae]|uniref:DUF1178 family protein n=1 Tax=Eleftheria terrae TaxID=1597781 RepID=UPI00263BB090|nr:DUF1178 family protein [Eleftheria terrae]WKB52687.1 DUF1178 family protein [Eleftheria terrae]
MKVLDLQCRHGHGFEGWFGSEDDFRLQQERQLVACPMCGDTALTRLPSAPRLNLSGAKESPAPPAAAAAPAAPPAGAMVPAEVQALWLKAVRHVMQNTENVGERFADEARRIHYGEAEARAIRGNASPEEAQALVEEGIDVMALPVPEALKDPVQ